MDQHLQAFVPFVNPQDLENHDDFQDFWDQTLTQHVASQPMSTGLPTLTERGNRTQDSAIDLTSYSNVGFPTIKAEDSFEAFFQTPYSTPTSNTPSPNTDNYIFSNANSPGDYTRDLSQTSSPETSNESMANDAWAAISIPQSIEPPAVFISLDKTKTRAETQIKTVVAVDALPAHCQWVRFPRHTLSKSKQLASEEEIVTNEKNDGTAHLDLTLVLATAVETDEGMERALRRARGDEKTPRRPAGVAIAEIDKSDRTHPQNGGAVIICEGCKEREAKRYNRKKKRSADEEDEWNGYENDRIIMINEKEFKRWQDTDADPALTSDSKKVEFAMRITCYCRHQEEKSPVGYRVIFTFKDIDNNLIAQQTSDIIQITDDHKNKENPADALPGTLRIPTQESLPQYTVPLYDYSPTMYSAYSQPTTPIIPHTPNLPHSQSAFFMRDGQYPQMANPGIASQLPPNGLPFCGSTIPTPAPLTQYANHQRHQSYFNKAVLSPTTPEQASMQAGYPLHRPHSMDSFPQPWGFPYSQQASYPQMFASQPPSRNPSRPASPSWEQGGPRVKKMRAVPVTTFYLAEDDEV